MTFTSKEMKHTPICTRTAGAAKPALKFPAWLVLDRSLLQQIPCGAYLVSARTNCDCAPVFATQITANSDLDQIWQDFLQAGAARGGCIVVDDPRQFWVLVRPIASDSRGFISMYEIGRRNALLNLLFAQSGRIAS